MSPIVRLRIFLIAAAGFAILLLSGVRGLPGFGNYPGPYGDIINHTAVFARHVTNTVTAVNFDYRALDTLGEEYILFVSVVGLALLLRGKRGEAANASPLPSHGRKQYERSEAVRWMGFGLIGLTNVFGIYIVLHAHLTPGGGFQGGAMLGTGSLLVYLATNYRVYSRATSKSLLDAGEAVGVGAYALIGLIALFCGAAFLQNVLPLGHTGDLLSAGTIPVINFVVGLAVSGGFALLFTQFLEETRQQKTEGEKEA